ncbi:2-C-methyl-D-erythritol 4-phosphate cytidylyltransferase [Chlorobium sp. N1]|uniref:2-C-methyl-D-erythritol 4-phosphate cytidylyltransferase n=1 Tax=Chlorobium sp. N1 TaxID=2491138 RepID=UPI001040BDD5|nr:2-C-methyl-D-erythritol 4-phosphate cytidylyltransferase [Chlorobium sp. N1]TCD48485.1 2-C-methyl-D-erythritol 4-phosphate cytidylyltransferase [Chlorobium sp. N1]
MKAIAIIAASGAGKRMRLPGGKSKQLLEIGGLPVIHHTLRAFEEAELVGEVYIATKAESIELLREMALKAGFGKVRHVLEGGAERQDSVGNCVRAIAESGSEAEAILVHDGARPFIRPSEIDEIVRLSLESGACVPANRPKDTIKFVGDDPRYFGATLDRSKLLQVQTPQGFRTELLVEAHTKAAEEGWYATDDAALVERYFPENPVRIYETGYHNIKITTPEDIGVAEAIYRSLREEG